MEQLILFSGTTLAALLGAFLGLGVGGILGGWLGALLTRGSRGENEGLSLTHIIRGGLVGLLPGLAAGGILGFRLLAAWLQG